MRPGGINSTARARRLSSIHHHLHLPTYSTSPIEVEHGASRQRPLAEIWPALSLTPALQGFPGSLDTVAFLAALACIQKTSQITNGWAQSARSFRVAAFGNRQRCRTSVLPVVNPTRTLPWLSLSVGS